jgi:AcrR family transcriptional regulator
MRTRVSQASRYHAAMAVKPKRQVPAATGRPLTPSPGAAKSAARRVTAQAREAFRTTLLDIARRIFLTEGYAAVSIRRITAEAGVTSMTFYWYFDSKEAMLTVIWDDILQEVSERCLNRSRAVRNKRERLLRFLEAFVDYWLDHPDPYRFVFVNETNGVDFAGLRSHLAGQAGLRQFLTGLDTLAREYYPDHPDREACVGRLRELSLYALLGYLQCTLCVFNEPAGQSRAHKALLLEQLGDSIDLWNPASPSAARRLAATSPSPLPPAPEAGGKAPRARGASPQGEGRSPA